MAVITVQIGQCGNQVGRDWLTVIADELTRLDTTTPTGAPAPAWDTFFRRPHRRDGGASTPVARCVQLDMEPKVIQQNLAATQRRGLFHYDPRHSQITSQEGSANNWAFGYAHKAPECADAVVQMVQQEADLSDGVGGLLLLHSLAGGTGSGVGAYLTAALRDAFPTTPLLNAVVWPYASGEVVLQDFNAVLCFAALQHDTDGLLVFANDKMHRLCQRNLKVERPAFADLNGIIATDLAGLMLPARHLSGISVLADPTSSSPALASPSRPPSSPAVVRDSQQLRALVRTEAAKAAPPPTLRSGAPVRWFADLRRLVFPHPGLKVGTLHCTPRMPRQHLSYSVSTWPGILKELRLMVAHGDADRDRWTGSAAGLRAVGALTVLRGADLHPPNDGELALLADPALHPGTQDPSGPSDVAVSPHAFQRYDRYGCTVVNSQALVGPAQAVLDRAVEKWTTGAYVHHFGKYGVEADTFQDAFTVTQRVIDDYLALSG